MVWEIVFMMVILKIPVAYLCGVVYWAIKSEPEPEGPVGLTRDSPDAGPGWGRRTRPRRLGPHGSPTRTYARTRRAALARAGAGR